MSDREEITEAEVTEALEYLLRRDRELLDRLADR